MNSCQRKCVTNFCYAYITAQIRNLSVGRGQMTSDTDGGFLLMFDKYKKEMVSINVRHRT